VVLITGIDARLMLVGGTFPKSSQVCHGLMGSFPLGAILAISGREAFLFMSEFLAWAARVQRADFLV